MIRSELKNRFKLAAIDLDGTLLGNDHQISSANARAVRQLQDAGAEVVLASGRHFNSMKKYADALPGARWMVSCQGGELSDVQRTTVLSRTFLPAEHACATMELGQSLGFTTVIYTTAGIFTSAAWDSELDFYTALAGHRPADLNASTWMPHDVFKVIWMGEPANISKVQLPLEKLPSTVQAVRTHARFLEFMPAHITKASALALLAERLGIASSEAVVFGDGENDIPMFEWAGTSVAMPHGWPAAISRATHVASAGPMETALARGVEMVANPVVEFSPGCSLAAVD